MFLFNMLGKYIIPGILVYGVIGMFSLEKLVKKTREWEQQNIANNERCHYEGC